MKKIIIIVLMINSTHLLALDSIPNHSVLSTQIAAAIKEKNAESLKKLIAPVDEVKKIFDSYSLNNPQDTISRTEIESKLKKKAYDASDSLIERIERFGINMEKAIFHNEKVQVILKDKVIENYSMADGEIKISFLDSFITIKYIAVYCKPDWKLFQIDNHFLVYNNENEYLGEMRAKFKSVDSEPIYYEDSTVTTTTTDTIKPDLPIPNFTDPEVQKMAEEYIAYIKQGLGIGTDPVKVEAFAKQGQELSTKIQDVFNKLSASPDKLKELSDFMQHVNQYFYENNNYSSTNSSSVKKEKPVSQKNHYKK